MTDAPMSPSEFARKLCDALSRGNLSPIEYIIKPLIADRDAAIRREAQAEAFERAACAMEKVATEHLTRLSGIRALSPDPNYIQRIVAQARLEEAKWWEHLVDEEHHEEFLAEGEPCIYCERIATLRDDLARLAADAEKEGK